MAISGNLRVAATFASYHQNPFRSSSPSSKVDFTGFISGRSSFSEITQKWNEMTLNCRNIHGHTKRLAGIMGDCKISPNAVSQDVESSLLNAINMNFFERLNLAWKIVFQSPATRRSSNANIAKQRLKMILLSDRCTVSEKAKQKIVKNIVRALLEIESKDKVQLSVSTDSDLGTIYSVTVPVRRVKVEYQEVTNIEYKDTGERSGSIDVRFKSSEGKTFAFGCYLKLSF